MWMFSGTKPLSGSHVIPFLLRNPVSGCTILARTKIVQKCLPFPSNVPLYDWWIVVCACLYGKVGYLSRKTLKYRQHSNNYYGALGSNFTGFLRRLKTKNKRLIEYATYRYNRRINIVHSAFKINNKKEIIKLLDFLSRPWFKRLLMTPAYFIFLIKHAKKLGFRAIIIEVVANTIPRNTDLLQNREMKNDRSVSG